MEMKFKTKHINCNSVITDAAGLLHFIENRLHFLSTLSFMTGKTTVAVLQVCLTSYLFFFNFSLPPALITLLTSTNT